MATIKTKGRSPKSGETRKAVTYRLTPKAIEQIKAWADLHGCSQSDEVIAMVDHFLKKD